MAWIYEDVLPPIIENTIMQKRFLDGVFKVYSIKAIDGYVLHDARLDYPSTDPETGEPLFDEDGNELITEGFAGGTVTCAASYDFTTNPWGFYAVPEDSVPADQIFGGVGNNDHEVM